MRKGTLPAIAGNPPADAAQPFGINGIIVTVIMKVRLEPAAPRIPIFYSRILRARPEIIESTFDRVRYGFTTDFPYHILWWCCVKKVRERHAVREMKADPSEPSCRGRLQTAMSCFGQKLG